MRQSLSRSAAALLVAGAAIVSGINPSFAMPGSAAMGGVKAAAPDPTVDVRYRYGRGAPIVAGLAAGLIGAAIVGAAASSHRHHYRRGYYDPYYYEPVSYGYASSYAYAPQPYYSYGYAPAYAYSPAPYYAHAPYGYYRSYPTYAGHHWGGGHSFRHAWGHRHGRW
jgi:hypothetical protein